MYYLCKKYCKNLRNVLYYNENIFAGGDSLDFQIKKLTKAKYKYHELHYTYSSHEHYVCENTSEKDIFSFTFKRQKRDALYEHDSYDILYDNVWKNVSCYGVFEKGNDGPIAYLELSREEWNDRLRITNLLVNENYRHQGIGSLLMKKAKEIAQKEDRRIITLETQTCNTPAIDFYLHHGFIFSGTNSKIVNSYI